MQEFDGRKIVVMPRNVRVPVMVESTCIRIRLIHTRAHVYQAAFRTTRYAPKQYA